jgi:hypothetical protein
MMRYLHRGASGPAEIFLGELLIAITRVRDEGRISSENNQRLINQNWTISELKGVASSLSHE